MRERYPLCFILGDGGEIFYDFCRSLRFSTHCKYTVIAPVPSFDTKNYIHFEYIAYKDLADLKLENFNEIFVINIKDDEIESYSFDDTSAAIQLVFDILHNNAVVSASSDDKVECFPNSVALDFLIREFPVENIVIQDFTLEANHCLAIDFFIDFEGSLVVLGAGTFRNNTEGSQFHPLPRPNFEFLKELFTPEIKIPDFENSFISICSVPGSKLFTPALELSLNKFKKHWMWYRSLGINIPLFFIQSLLRRKSKSFYFLDSDQIRSKNNKIFYDIDCSNVYFDLDDTLVWSKNGSPIIEVRTKLLELKEAGAMVNLLTRNLGDVLETLRIAEIDPDLFNHIFQVSASQNKSDFVPQKSIFIDNEFGERLDVRLNCEIPVLDLHQLDFLDLDSVSFP